MLQPKFCVNKVGRYKWLRAILYLMVIVFTALLYGTPSVSADPVQPAGKLDLTGMGIVRFSSPTLVNIDQDAALEILVGTVDGKVAVVDHSVTGGLVLRWSYDTSIPFNKPTTIRGSISAADLDNDGSIELVVPIGDISAVDSAGGIVVLDANGSLRWFYETYDKTGDNSLPDGRTDGVIGAPALGDIDNDGDLEIMFGSVDHRLYAFHHDGQIVSGWPRFIRDTVWPSPALADLNNDGSLEIIIGVDTHIEPAFGTPDGGGLYVMNADGTDYPGWPRFIDQVIYSSPAVADLDGDGSFEIIHGTGPFFNNPGAGYKVYVWDTAGNLKWTGQTQGYTFASPAIGNLDDDPQLEVVITSREDQSTHVWNHDGSLLWSRIPRDLTGKSMQLSVSPILADYNNDGKADVFVSVFWESAILDGPTGNQFTATSFPNNPNPSYYGNYTVDSSPAVGDIDGDGQLELVLAGGNNSSGASGQVLYWNLSTPATEAATPWPMFSQNAAHTGLYQPTPAFDAQLISHTFPEVVQTGSTYPISLTFRNTGSQTWTPNNVGLASPLGNSPTPIGISEQVAPGETITIQFSWQAPANATYQDLNWRLIATDSLAWFGDRASVKMKVSNQPALQVLTSEGIFAGGLTTTPFQGPQGLWNWPAAKAWKLTSGNLGYRILDSAGAVWTGGKGMPLWPPPTRSDYQDIVFGADGVSLWLLASDGTLVGCYTDGCELTFNPAVPTGIAARSLALTRDGKGVYVVDGFGNLYGGGTAPGLPAAPGFPTTADVIIRMKLTKDGQGYYLLDKYGQVHAGGNAPALAPGYQPQLGVDWAIDFELTDDEKGYYLLVRDGTILPGGNAEALTVNVPPVKGSDFARDLELVDSRRSAPGPGLAIQTQPQSRFIAQGDARSLTFQKVIQNTGAVAADWTVRASWNTGGNLPTARVEPNSGALQPGALQVVSITIPNMGEENVGSYQLDVTARAAAAGGEAIQTSTISIEVVDNVFDTYLPSTLR